MDYLISDTTLDNIATAIREKTGKQDKMTPVQMPDEIRGIPGGAEPEPPDDGKTRLYITVPANAMPNLPPPRNQVPLYIQQSVANGVTIDWGDGSAPETLPGTSAVNATHTYQQAGDYVINLDPVEGCELLLGDGNQNCVMGASLSSSQAVYRTMLKRVVFGNRGLTHVGPSAFRNCYPIYSVSIGSGINYIDSSALSGCYSVKSVILPDTLHSIWNLAFNNCYSIASIIIPSNVSSIWSSAFQGCYGMKEYHFLSTDPPNLENANAFQGIPDDCIIYVPVGSLEAYQTATNWSTYADQMQEEPA